mmetsp:Transcript_6133/g.18175  ORF Transcript_6133/g.18175 Transcript_6133/m.18175 type:complete len:303 (-) Transcript_6133:797-1705(-)
MLLVNLGEHVLAERVGWFQVIGIRFTLEAPTATDWINLLRSSGRANGEVARLHTARTAAQWKARHLPLSASSHAANKHGVVRAHEIASHATWHVGTKSKIGTHQTGGSQIIGKIPIVRVVIVAKRKGLMDSRWNLWNMRRNEVRIDDTDWRSVSNTSRRKGRCCCCVSDGGVDVRSARGTLDCFVWDGTEVECLGEFGEKHRQPLVVQCRLDGRCRCACSIPRIEVDVLIDTECERLSGRFLRCRGRQLHQHHVARSVLLDGQDHRSRSLLAIAQHDLALILFPVGRQELGIWQFADGRRKT